MKTKKIKHQIILAGDIGGTKTRLGFYQVEKNGFSPSVMNIFFQDQDFIIYINF